MRSHLYNSLKEAYESCDRDRRTFYHWLIDNQVDVIAGSNLTAILDELAEDDHTKILLSEYLMGLFDGRRGPDRLFCILATEKKLRETTDA